MLSTPYLALVLPLNEQSLASCHETARKSSNVVKISVYLPKIGSDVFSVSCLFYDWENSSKRFDEF
ncbi:hypothetical protein EA58_19000 [Photobacterium galatheae]|uniref:Uncharacterized protein n=1 Tax=Photobacterium galatheae TaxID=1654360 RepID=A0A066RHU9_9GAMM|nr:hypothetical protein EA58_19000 [Photobacterium galatheae]